MQNDSNGGPGGIRTPTTAGHYGLSVARLPGSATGPKSESTAGCAAEDLNLQPAGCGPAALPLELAARKMGAKQGVPADRLRRCTKQALADAVPDGKGGHPRERAGARREGQPGRNDGSRDHAGQMRIARILPGIAEDPRGPHKVTSRSGIMPEAERWPGGCLMGGRYPFLTALLFHVLPPFLCDG